MEEQRLLRPRTGYCQTVPLLAAHILALLGRYHSNSSFRISIICKKTGLGALIRYLTRL